MKFEWALAVGVLVCGCSAIPPPPDTAKLGRGAFGGTVDTDTTAINLSAWAFAMPSNTRDRPVEAARAVAAVDYLAGELSSNPRFYGMSPITKTQMLQARVELRHALGVTPDASSQVVVTALLGAADALIAHDQLAALKALDTQAFSNPPTQTLALLNALPYLPKVNIATKNAEAEQEPGSVGPT